MAKRLPKAIRPFTVVVSAEVTKPIPEPDETPMALVVQQSPQKDPVELAAGIRGTEGTPRPIGQAERGDRESAKRQKALKFIENFAFWAGAAGAIPLPGLDLAGIGAIQIQMIRRLSEIYDVEFSRDRAKAISAGLGAALISGSSGLGAASLAKSVPLVGTALSSIATPSIAAAATYAVGMAFLEHFSSGGTLLNFRMKAVPRTGGFRKG